MRRLPSLAAGFALAAAFVLALAGAAHAQDKGDLENMLYLETAHGRVTIKLRPDLAPNHVARVKELVRQKFYDGTPFHRVIDGFMAQGGDPTGTGTGGSGKKIKAEFSKEPFKRGTIGAARSQNPDSADSQFFICFTDVSHLNGQYTVWGQVVSGMEFVDRIRPGEPPANPDRIVRMTVAADARTIGAEVRRLRS